MTMAIDAEGNVKLPDPNREITRRQLEQENFTVIEESYLRRDEKIVYAIVSNSIYIPATKTTLMIRGLSNTYTTAEDFQTIAVYELDDQKTIVPGNDMPSAGNSVNPAWEAENLRRANAYDAHLKSLRKQLGIAENRE
jgi:hypothetical protein